MIEEGAIVKTLEAAAAPLLDKGNPMVARAEAFVVADAGAYKKAGEVALEIKRVGDAIFEVFDDPCKDAHKLHKKLTGLRSKLHTPFVTAYKLLTGKMGTWRTDEEARVRREQEAAEFERQAAAAKQAREAEELRQAKMPEAAEAMVADTPPPPAPVIRSEVPKVKGISARKTWKYTVVDGTAVKRAFLILNEPLIRDIVKRMGKQAEEQVGGIKVEEDTVMAGRTG